jgi:ABC-type oligopeptide transport system substrate-binding subunit
VHFRYLGKNSRFGPALLGLVIAAGLALANCDSSNGDGERKLILNRSLNGGPESLDPHKFSTTQAGDVLRDLGEGLLAYSADGELIGGAASNWTVSQDGRTYVFHIRPNARWSNGKQLTANDFVFAFRRLVTPSTAAQYAEFLSAVENTKAIVRGELPPDQLGVSAIDPSTLMIRLISPTPYFVQLLTHPSTYPIHPESVRIHADDFVRPGNFVTNGAYQLDDWIVGSKLALSRNIFYWDNDGTEIDAVNHLVLDEASEINRFRAGELDITGNVISGMFSTMREERPDELHVSAFLAVYYYGFNLERSPFMGNPKLRRALSMAIDRDAIVKHITRRGEKPAYGWVPTGIDNYTAQRFDYSNLASPEREAESRRLYREAGYGPSNPLRFELRYNTSDVQQRIALAIQSMWREVLGVEVKLVNEEFKVLMSNIKAREITQSFRLSWTGDYNDAYTFLQLFDSENPSNLTSYSSSVVDALLNEATKEVDPTKRRSLLEEAERVALADHPVIPIYFYVSKHLVNNRVLGWEDNVLDFHYTKHLSLRVGSTEQ